MALTARKLANQRAWREKNRPKVRAYSCKYRAAEQRDYRDATDAIKRERGCAVCGEREPCCLEFHHRDPAEKKFTIGENRRGRPHQPSWKRVTDEIAKCEVLCCNCHKKVHRGIVTLLKGEARCCLRNSHAR